MKISVAMTTYNGGRFLREQLDSIRRQTLLPSELVLCDDGSTDDTLEIARQFAAAAPFPVVIDAHGQSLGFTRNFVRCIGLCTGEVVALCDQDDIWDESKLAIAVAPFADPSVVTVTHRVRVVNQDLIPTGLILPPLAFQGRYRGVFVDPWFVPNGMQMLFRRSSIQPWLTCQPPYSAYGYGPSPFDEWIIFAGTLAGDLVVLKNVLGVWRRHDAVASVELDNVARDNSAAHQLHLALHSGREAYAFRAEVTDARAKFASQTVALADGTLVQAADGVVEFYRGMSRMFRRRERLHDPKLNRLNRLRAFGEMLASRDHRSRHRGGLGAKAMLKDVFTLFFGPRAAPPADENTVESEPVNRERSVDKE